MAQNWLHILSSWLLLPRHTFKKINQEKCYPHIFPPPFFFSALKQQLHCFAFALRECSQPWPRQGKGHIGEEATPLAAGWGLWARLALPPLHLELSSLPLPLSLLGLWDITSLGDPRSGLSYNCSLVFVSLDQGTLTPYLKPDHKGNLNSKSNSVLRLES